MQLLFYPSHAGLTPEEAKAKPYIASMGIYVFKKDVLLKLLQEASKDEQVMQFCLSVWPLGLARQSKPGQQVQRGSFGQAELSTV